MSRSLSLRANALAMLMARLLPPVFAFGIHLGIARLSGPETLGAYVNLLAVLMIFQAIAGAGMQFLVAREIAAFPDRAAAHARTARAFGLISGSVATAAYGLYAWWLLPPDRLLPAMVLGVTILPSAWIALQEAIFIAMRSHYCVALVAVVENSIKLGVALYALSTGRGLLTICAGIAVARLAGLATGGWLVRQVGVRGSWRIQIGTVAPFARTMAPFSLLFIVSMAYFRIDVPIVQAIAGEGATGFYGAAVALYGALLLLPESALSAAYPRLARAFHTSRDGYARATWLVAKVVTLGLVPVSLALIAMADTIVAWAYGAHFAPAVSVLRLLALSLPLHALNGALGQALQAGGEQRAMVGVVSFGFLVHLVLNIALVHWLGIRGAALAMLISSSCVAAGALRAVHQRIAPVHVTAGLIPAALAVAGPLLLVSLAPGGFQIAAAMFGCVWLVLGAFLSGMLAPADIEGIRSALGSPRAGATA